MQECFSLTLNIVVSTCQCVAIIFHYHHCHSSEYRSPKRIQWDHSFLVITNWPKYNDLILSCHARYKNMAQWQTLLLLHYLGLGLRWILWCLLNSVLDLNRIKMYAIMSNISPDFWFEGADKSSVTDLPILICFKVSRQRASKNLVSHFLTKASLQVITLICTFSLWWSYCGNIKEIKRQRK